LKHLGATPMAVAQTRRLHFAKKLIDETKLPMNQIALAAGFGCVRRFNAGIRKVYHRTPTQIRKLARWTEAVADNHYVFRLHFRPPYHWLGILDFLAARATPGVEVVEDGKYRRTISLHGKDGYFEVSLAEGRDALLLRIAFGDPQSLFIIVERVRAMFDLNADWSAIVKNLRSDPILHAGVEAHPGIRVPGCWDGFELAVRAILGQQITVKGATTMAGRIASRFGRPFDGPSGLTHVFPAPEVLANVPLADIGLTGARIGTIRALARAVCSGTVTFGSGISSESFLNQLCEISGIGKWTAQYVAMRAMGEPDAFPSTDLGLLRGIGLKGSRDLEIRAESWRPWRAYAAMYLWSLERQSPSQERRTVPGKNRNVNTAIPVPYRPASIVV
jgi:AraC family transcriptional regulator of adaptative response / DNA-3-methyladenine glycosylase II